MSRQNLTCLSYRGLNAMCFGRRRFLGLPAPSGLLDGAVYNSLVDFVTLSLQIVSWVVIFRQMERGKRSAVSGC